MSFLANLLRFQGLSAMGFLLGLAGFVELPIGGLLEGASEFGLRCGIGLLRGLGFRG